MNNARFGYMKELYFLLGNDTGRAVFMIFLFILASIVDLIGLGLIVPFVSILINPEMVMNSGYYHGLMLDKLEFDSTQMSYLISGLLALVFLIKMWVAISINKSIVRFGFDKGVQIRLQLMHAFQEMSYARLLNINSANITHLILTVSSQFSNFLQSIFRLITESAVTIVLLFALGYQSGYELILLVVLLGGTVFLYDRIFKVRIEEYGKLSNELSSKMIKGVREGVEGSKELRILGKQGYFYDIVSRSAKEYANFMVKLSVIDKSPRYILESILVLFIVFLVVFGLYLGTDMQSLLPTLSMFGVASMRLMPAANQIMTSISQIRFNKHSTNLLYKFLNEESFENLDSENDKIKIDSFKQLLLKDVNFKYPGTKSTTIRGINLRIDKGDSVGFIGPSGSGKTTLIDIIIGLIKPDSGQVLYNGQLLNNRNKPEYIAYLPQQTLIIDESLRRNITLDYDDSMINDVDLKQAIDRARLSDWADELPEGLDTMMGERGAHTSGGQRQRVALARAFYHNRNILVMDESTSALDHEVESEVVDEIKKLKGTITMIVIAHRLSTLKHCDRIYRIKDGCIVSSGSYNDIIKNNEKTENIN